MTYRNEVYRAAAPFSRAIDSSVCIRQEHLDELRGSFDASENPDFSIASYQTKGLHALPQGRLFHLPFRLALGLHNSVEPMIDFAAANAVYDAYKEVETVTMQSMRTKFERNNAKQDRVDSAIIGALIEAASDRNHEDRVAQAEYYVRKAKMIGKINRTGLKDLIKTMSVT